MKGHKTLLVANPAPRGFVIEERRVLAVVTRLRRVSSRSPPVIVLTSSQSDDELILAYEAGANACLRKPVNPEEFTDLIQTFAEFWTGATALPSSPENIENS